MLNTIVTFVRRAALAVALAATSGFAAAGTIHVAIDTSVFDADSGYLDFSLSSFASGVPLATATISNLTGFGKAARDESVSFGFGEAGASYVLRNDAPNYLSHAVDFGGELAFDLTFAGDYDKDSYLSHFAVWLLDSDFQPLGSANSTNFAMLEYRWTPSPTEGGQGSVGTVPEPGALLLMAAGAAGMALARRRRSAKLAA